MSTDWTARTAALEFFENQLKVAERYNHDDRDHMEQAVNALRRSQDHTAIQTKLHNTTKALRHYTSCPHGSVDCFCTKEARAQLGVEAAG